MARKATTRKAGSAIDESRLTKGELRKLNALRKSLCDKIADRTFTQWFRQKTWAKAGAPIDSNAELIASTLLPLAKAGKLRIGCGGYLVKRGKGRVIVSRRYLMRIRDWSKTLKGPTSRRITAPT